MESDDRLKKIEMLLEKMLEELVIEAVGSDPSITLPIPTKIFLEMEDIAGETINLIGIS
tara:strand:+ start:7092 stop:7268 length:177 start_codon:yes stop_codon:yes gene_type:complete